MRDIKVIVVESIVGACIIGSGLWVWHRKQSVVSGIESNFNAATVLGDGNTASDLTEYAPPLGIHPKSNAEAIYTKPIKKSYNDGILYARSTDFYNPAQVQASTGDPKSLTQSRSGADFSIFMGQGEDSLV